MSDESASAAALNNLALILHDYGELTRAIEFSLQALEIYQRICDRHRTAAVHSNLADLYHETGQDGQAMIHLKASAVILTEIGEKASERRPEIWKLTEW